MFLTVCLLEVSDATSRNEVLVGAAKTSLLPLTLGSSTFLMGVLAAVSDIIYNYYFEWLLFFLDL